MDVGQYQLWPEGTTLLALDKCLKRNITIKIARVRSRIINIYTTDVTAIDIRGVLQ